MPVEGDQRPVLLGLLLRLLPTCSGDSFGIEILLRKAGVVLHRNIREGWFAVPHDCGNENWNATDSARLARALNWTRRGGINGIGLWTYYEVE